jgi:hypothetical protein
VEAAWPTRKRTGLSRAAVLVTLAELTEAEVEFNRASQTDRPVAQARVEAPGRSAMSRQARGLLVEMEGLAASF